MKYLKRLTAGIAGMVLPTLFLAVPTNAIAQDKPLNFLIIWGDDVGMWNVSAYNQGMMGYETPNIDRIAKEGMLFTHA